MAHGSFLLCNVAIKIVVFNIFQIVDLAVDHPSFQNNMQCCNIAWLIMKGKMVLLVGNASKYITKWYNTFLAKGSRPNLD